MLTSVVSDTNLINNDNLMENLIGTDAVAWGGKEKRQVVCSFS